MDLSEPGLRTIEYYSRFQQSQLLWYLKAMKAA
jgi:hypothetical protein